MSALPLRTGPETFDQAARETQVTHDQRVAPLHEDDFSDEARELADAVRSVVQIKDAAAVPAMFATMFKHPGVYRAQMQMGLEIAKFGSLPPRERELAILRVAWLCRSPFEWGEHVDAGKRHGLTGDEIARVRRGSDDPDWLPFDRAVVRGVEELIGDYMLSDGTWAALSEKWTEKQRIELCALAGAYAMTAMLYNSLRLPLLAGNAGFDQE